jgi:hypothetical protein
MYGLFLVSMNIYGILEQSQKHRFQNADMWEVPIHRLNKVQTSPVVLGAWGIVNPWTTAATLPTSVKYSHLCTILR